MAESRGNLVRNSKRLAVGWMMLPPAPCPPNAHIPIPATWEYVTSHGKRDFADASKVKDLEVERLFWIIWVGLM